MFRTEERHSRHKRESRPARVAERLPKIPSLDGSGIDADSKIQREAQLFAEGLLRDIERWRHRERRRWEGVHGGGR